MYDYRNIINIVGNMTLEEKAKAYDEALERFKSFKEKYCTKSIYLGDILFDKTGEMQKDFEEIFPQLNESKDERIRKALIDGVRQIRCKNGITQEQMIAYLEKLKEQKPAWSEEDVKRLYSIGTQIGFLKGKYSEYQKDIDWLYALAEKMGFHKCKTGEIVTEWKKEDIDDKMLSKPKQEWSEEDEKMRNLAIEWAETMYGQFRFVDMGSTDFRKIVAWLKSLRPSWKPSEEQMKALQWWAYQDDELRSLLNDLKKL